MNINLRAKKCSSESNYSRYGFYTTEPLLSIMLAILNALQDFQPTIAVNESSHVTVLHTHNYSQYSCCLHTFVVIVMDM